MTSPGVLAVHSVEQADIAKRTVGRCWRVELVPYQVDTDFWQRSLAESAPADARPLIVAVGARTRS